MTVTVYVDQWFLINWGMDLLLLLLAGRLMGRSAKAPRLAAGAALGAAIGLAGLLGGLVLGLPRLFWGASLLAGSPAMARAAFGPLTFRELARITGGIYIAAVLMGGTVYGLAEILPKTAAAAGSGLCLALGAFFAVRAAVGFLNENRSRRARLCPVRLFYRGKERKVTALWDTGNQLYEPSTGRPVHILDREACEGLVVSVPAVFYVPYQSIGCAGGVLPAIALDRMELTRDGRMVSIEKPLVAISSRPVSPKREYQMLLHGKIPE